MATHQEAITEAMGKAFEYSSRGADTQDVINALHDAGYVITPKSECLCWVQNMGTRHTRIQHPECPSHPVHETTEEAMTDKITDHRFTTKLRDGVGPYGPLHPCNLCGKPQMSHQLPTEPNETEHRHLADGLRVAAPVQPEMDALRAALAVWADKLDWEPTGSLGCVTAYDVADAARAVLTVYDEQVAAMERARNFHVNETMLRKLTEG